VGIIKTIIGVPKEGIRRDIVQPFWSRVINGPDIGQHAQKKKKKKKKKNQSINLIFLKIN
jgi:hypothetical protein